MDFLDTPVLTPILETGLSPFLEDPTSIYHTVVDETPPTVDLKRTSASPEPQLVRPPGAGDHISQDGLLGFPCMKSDSDNTPCSGNVAAAPSGSSPSTSSYQNSGADGLLSRRALLRSMGRRPPSDSYFVPQSNVTSSPSGDLQHPILSGDLQDACQRGSSKTSSNSLNRDSASSAARAGCPCITCSQEEGPFSSSIPDMSSHLQNVGNTRKFRTYSREILAGANSDSDVDSQGFYDLVRTPSRGVA